MNLTRLLLLSITATATAAAHSQELRNCRALPETAARLACYDGLPLPATAPPPAAPPAAPSGDAAFGLQGPARGEVAAVSSSVAGRFEGWGAKSRIRLANGQVWEVTDGSSAAAWLLNPQITVRRAALGSYLLEVEGMNGTARVRRVE